MSRNAKVYRIFAGTWLSYTQLYLTGYFFDNLFYVGYTACAFCMTESLDSSLQILPERSFRKKREYLDVHVVIKVKCEEQSS